MKYRYFKFEFIDEEKTFWEEFKAVDYEHALKQAEKHCKVYTIYAYPMYKLSGKWEENFYDGFELRFEQIARIYNIITDYSNGYVVARAIYEHNKIYITIKSGPIIHEYVFLDEKDINYILRGIKLTRDEQSSI